MRLPRFGYHQFIFCTWRNGHSVCKANQVVKIMERRVFSTNLTKCAHGWRTAVLFADCTGTGKHWVRRDSPSAVRSPPRTFCFVQPATFSVAGFFRDYVAQPGAHSSLGSIGDFERARIPSETERSGGHAPCFAHQSTRFSLVASHARAGGATAAERLTLDDQRAERAVLIWPSISREQLAFRSKWASFGFTADFRSAHLCRLFLASFRHRRTARKLPFCCNSAPILTRHADT